MALPLTYDTGAVGSGSAGSVVPSPYFSSEAGLDTVNQTKQKVDALTPPLKIPIEQTPEQRAKAIADAKQLPEPKTGQTGYSLDDVLLLTKDLTGWKRNPDGTYTPDATALKNIGVQPGSQQVIDDQQAVVDAAKSERDAAYTKLSSFNVDNDPALKAVLDGISASWDARIHEMEASNKSRIGAITQTGIRAGSRYTGGMGGTFGSIISGEEQASVNRIADLERQKQAALSDAKNAYSNNQWNRYYQLAGIADKRYQEQLDEVKALNKAQAEQDKKIQEVRDEQTLNDNIYNAAQQLGDTADTASIYSKMRNAGLDVTIEQVDAAWKKLQPKESTDGLYKFTQPQVAQLMQLNLPGETIQQIQDDLNRGGLDTVLEGFGPEVRDAVKNILYKTPAGNGVTINELQDLFAGTAYPELAVQFFGKSESQVMNLLQDPTPPQFFIQAMQAKGSFSEGTNATEMNILPGSALYRQITAAWDAFRTAFLKQSSATGLGALQNLLNQPTATTTTGGEFYGG